MGTGISAGIPIELKPQFGCEKKYFHSTFFNHYDKDDETGFYHLKKDFLVENYVSFLDEFYELIGETEELSERNIPIVSTFEEFENAFDRNSRNGRTPFISTYMDFLGEDRSYCWNFYDGSYKAFLEEWSTLLHCERILLKAMKNPLAAVVKFGMFG